MGDQAPTIGRPRGAAWRSLQAEGIAWEGQVRLTGAGVDLAARLIVTHARLAFVHEGAIVLDVAREWLRPAPTLSADGTLLLFITAPGARIPEPVRIIVQDGRRAAAHLVSLLTGSGVRPASNALPLYIPEPMAEPPTPKMARPRPVEPTETWEATAALPTLEALNLDDLPPLVDDVPEPPRPNGTHGPSTPPARFTPSHAASSGAGRSHDWDLRPVPGMTPRSARHNRRNWIIRLSGLVILLVAAAAIGAGRLVDTPQRDLAAYLPGIAGDSAAGDRPEPSPTPPRSAGGAVAAASTATADISLATSTSLVPPTAPPSQTAIALGVGGINATGEAVAEPTSTATAGPAEPPTEHALPSATLGPAESSAPPAPTATPTPTPAPTEPVLTESAVPSATSAPTWTTTPSPTSTATAVPSPTSSPTPEISLAAAVRSQRATVGSGELPAQVIVVGAFRYTIEAAVRGRELPQLTLTNTGDGEWVVLIVHALNWSNENAPLTMSEFRLASSGVPTAVPLDANTGAVASFLGFVPAYPADAAALFAPGEGHRLALVFLTAPDADGLTLLVGDRGVDLSLAFARPVDVTRLGPAPVAPDLVEATVVDVIDGRTIEVEVEGERARVRYLGIEVPTDNACYAAEAWQANAALVRGRPVWLERERKNRLDETMVARDVWVAGADGTKRLVAAELVTRGAAVPAPDRPDVRFAGWLADSGAAARAAGLGLWGACGGIASVGSSDPSGQLAAAPRRFLVPNPRS